MNNTIDSATSELEIAKTLPNNILVGVEAISLCAPATIVTPTLLMDESFPWHQLH
ncbi:hypothetical protein AAC387_Pa01g3202 [Persea americana]